MNWKIDEAEDLPLAVREDTEAGFGVCEIGSHFATKSQALPKQLANARLIAAAPDLLAVLKQIHQDYRNFVEDEDGDLFDERMGANMEDAEQVITKAERT